MIRGTTPAHVFNLPFETSLIQEVRVTYAQGGAKVLEKTEADCTLEDKCIIVELTQEETLKFTARVNVEVQVKLLTTAGEVMASKIQTVSVERCLNEEVFE